MLRDFEIVELQADELYTFIDSKSRPTWLFTIEVCSRLWASSLVGRRSYRNTKAGLNDVILRGRLVGIPLIATDGFEYYFGVIARLIGPACVYGQVLKTRRNNRVIRVDRRVKVGTETRLKNALLESEDSATLNAHTRPLSSASTSRFVKARRTYVGGRHATPVVRTSYAATSSSCVAITISSGRTVL